MDGLAGMSRVKNSISRRCGYNLQGQFERRQSLSCLPSRETVRVVVRGGHLKCLCIHRVCQYVNTEVMYCREHYMDLSDSITVVGFLNGWLTVFEQGQWSWIASYLNHWFAISSLFISRLIPISRLARANHTSPRCCQTRAKGTPACHIGVRGALMLYLNRQRYMKN